MTRQYLFANKIGIGILAMLVILVCSLPLPVFSQPAAGIDIDDSDPVRLTSKIMEIHLEEGRLVVAEQSVWIVDFMLANGQQFTTALENSKGHPIALEAFARRQLVLVQGFKLPDGRIIAARVQQIERRQKEKKHPVWEKKRRIRTVRPVR